MTAERAELDDFKFDPQATCSLSDFRARLEMLAAFNAHDLQLQ